MFFHYILDLNKIESAKMTLVDRSYSVKTLINNIINMTSMREETKKLEFITEISPDIPSVLFGDDIRVQQIIMNLLTNAVKYFLKSSLEVTSNLTRRCAMSLGDSTISVIICPFLRCHFLLVREEISTFVGRS